MRFSAESADPAPIALVPAEPRDAALTFAWRNASAVRRFFHDPGELTFEGHQQWWSAAVAAADRHLLLAKEAGVTIGVLRLDQQGDSAEVSIYLDPAQMGRGLGRAVLEAGAAYAIALGIRTLIASIKDANLASRSAFAAAGFAREGDQWVRVLMP